MKAWIIEWDWSGEHAKVDNRFVTVLSARCSDNQIKAALDLLYSVEKYSLRARFGFAKYNNPDKKPYQPEVECGTITLGHNPWLVAKRVDFSLIHNSNLIKYTDNQGNKVEYSCI